MLPGQTPRRYLVRKAPSLAERWSASQHRLLLDTHGFDYEFDHRNNCKAALRADALVRRN